MSRTVRIGFTCALAAVVAGPGCCGRRRRRRRTPRTTTSATSWTSGTTRPTWPACCRAAIAEARIAAQHASLAARDPGNLDAIKLHTAHVLHAVDPSRIENGPGQGYGVRRAAEGAAKHIMAAANSDGASGAVKAHSEHVATSAGNTVARADEIVMLAEKIAMTESAADAAGLVAELNTWPRRSSAASTRTRTGRIGWQEGEGGLEVAETHANLMKQAEGLQ